MSTTTHIIPVGFDYERLLHPISKGDLNADRVRLVDGKRSDTDEGVVELTDRMLRELRYAFENHLDIEVTTSTIENIYDYRRVYRTAYAMLEAELEEGNAVWVNISSMPRTVSFAFAAAANTHVAETPEKRKRLHTYYVRPEKYFAPQMQEELEKEVEFLRGLEAEGMETDISSRLKDIEELVAKINRSGITKGAKEMEDGNLYVEFPATPLPNLRDFEIEIMRFLDERGTMQSTSELAREFGKTKGTPPDSDDFESFRSKVQYNVDNLEQKGYIERKKTDNRYETSLSITGTLWVDTHLKDSGDPDRRTLEA